jgi:uncharacterized protein YbcC (UPF0753/DUF2309 family)
LQWLKHSIEHAAHLLPAQGPIVVFVHHNTLHALEHLPFEQAVVQGGETFGCHPYLPEADYRRDLARGRIQTADIEAALIDDLGDRADELLGFLGTRFHLRLAMLGHPLLTGTTAELRWLISEADALRRFRAETSPSVRHGVVQDTRHWVMRDLRNGRLKTASERMRQFVARVLDRYDKHQFERWGDADWEALTLQLTWLICEEGLGHVEPAVSTSNALPRHHDLLKEATGEDTDRRIDEVLIPFCAAMLDQGFARWSLPGREKGFLESFRGLYERRVAPADTWMRGLPAEMNRLRAERLSPLESIADSLQRLGVSRDEHDSYIRQTMLALRGFAGMIWQTETRPDRVAHPTPPGTLIEYLAIRLILERLALAHVARRSISYTGPLDQLRDELRRRSPRSEPTSLDQRAFLVFQLAQVLGWQPQTLAELSNSQWCKMLHEIESFSGLERRRVYHLAYERRYRIQSLDAVSLHSRQAFESPLTRQQSRSAFQIICCIDEREESFRRHLEEVTADCETYGAAGFFSIAMYYRGAADTHYTPLCPVIVTPRHYVSEEVVYSLERTARRRRQRRRTIGTVTHQVHLGSRTFAGGWLAATLGSLASIPLVMRILFPRATARLRRLVGRFVRTPAVTRLQLERTEELPGKENGHVGFHVTEMADIVQRMLTDIGLTANFSRLIVVCGHGSSSLNNPHESAHDCGACGGGRGGPNARAFAEMANDMRVRQVLVQRGLSLPVDTIFVGAYHNTCDDSLTWYDLDRLPLSHRDDLDQARLRLDDARQRSAHERCRRFESAELSLTPEAALRHVEGRAEDLSQVRPEYGHATNALCFIGRRQWSRGLFLDRRAFLQSYDPRQDDEQHSILTRILQAVIPVCAGINLEYYFSFVDPTGYGCGTKLPHNITSLLGVMNGAASDLRPGLPWQMVEIHEPVRLLLVIETTPQAMLQIIECQEGIARLVRGRWVQLATLDPTSGQVHVYRDGLFEPYRVENSQLPRVAASVDWYRGWRDHLGFAQVTGDDIGQRSLDWNAAEQPALAVSRSDPRRKRSRGL